MQTITKQQAATLYGNSYLLQDKEGRKWDVFSIEYDSITLFRHEKHDSIFLDQIGVDYFILARPLSELTKSITHKGETFVPIVELFKIAGFATWDYETYNYFQNVKLTVEENQIRGVDKDITFIFLLEGKSFRTIKIEPRYEDCKVANQSDLFDKLREWNFSLSLPDGSWIPVTEQNNPYN